MTDAPPLRSLFGEPGDADVVRELRRFLDMAPAPMSLMGPDGRVLHVNPALCQLMQWPLASVLGRSADELLAPPDRRYALARTREGAPSPMVGPVGAVETMTAIRGDGAHVPLEVSISQLDGPYDGLMLTVVRDVTTDLEVESQASETARLYGMLAAANGAVLRSRSRAEVFDELCRVATHVGDFRMAWVAIEGEDGRLTPVAAAGPALGPAMERPSAGSVPIAEAAWRRRELVVVHDIAEDPLTAVHRGTSARARTRSGCAIPIQRRGEVIGIFSTYMERVGGYDHRRLELLEQLVDNVSFALEAIDDRARHRELAFSDPLTGLPNRTQLFTTIERAALAARPDHAIAVLLVDLDGFKDVNDALGHDTGDQLLVAVAERLSGAVRPADFVARLGGDEFAVLCADGPGRDVPVEVAEAISRSLEEPFLLEGIQTFITSSIGITVRASRDTDVRALLREADAALYVAKEAGRNRWELYDDHMRRRALERLELSNALRLAADEGQLRLLWQPVVALQEPGPDTRSLIGPGLRRSWVSLEALLRWEHPTLGTVAPDRFITLAEETGLIVPMGEWVLHEALAHMADWTAGDPEAAPDVIAINLSARQLAQRDLVATIRDALATYELDPRRVALEITETAVLVDPASTLGKLRQLRELGLHVAIDDFGTGYSSLAYLRDLPADALKIDRSFISRLGAGGADDDIVRTVIGLAHGFDLVVVGEGIETPEQRDRLVAMGCDRGQGFLWAPPLEAGAVADWIRDHRAAG